MSTPLSYPSTLMQSDETLFVVRQPTQVPQGVTYVDGKPVHDASQMQLFRCVCNVQPITGEALARLEEGDDITDQLYVWTMNQADELSPGDLFVRHGKRYECQDVDTWGNYTRARFALDQTRPAFDPDSDTSFLP